MEMELPEKDDEGRKKCPRINQYNMEFLMEMICKAMRKRRDCPPTFEMFKVSTRHLAQFYLCEEVGFSSYLFNLPFQLKAIEDTCYPKTSRYIVSSWDMESLNSVATSSVSGGVPLFAEIGFPLAHQLQGVLAEVERVGPSARLKSQASKCLAVLKDTLKGLVKIRWINCTRTMCFPRLVNVAVTMLWTSTTTLSLSYVC